MILVGQYDSPVTRRVAIALHHYGMPFTRDTRSIFGDAAAVGKISPLTRIPALVLDDGEVLIDSAAILDHLDEQADMALIPVAGPARRHVLQMTALAQGTLEKVAAVVYERHFHSAEHRSADWLARCLGQARAGLDELTRRLATPYACGETLTHADVMITTLIWYMQDRMDEVLSPTDHAALIGLAEQCEALPAFRAAALSDFEKMPRS
jgi:glutathione S-transferase